MSGGHGARGATGRAVLAVLVLLLVSVGAGALWIGLSRPPEWLVTEQGIVLTEEASGLQVGVELLFVAIGAALSLVWAVVVGFVLRRLGWVLAPIVVAGTLLASVVTWRVGLWLGPGDPAATTDPQIGDLIPAQPTVDALASFLVWPIAGLLGLLLITWATGRRSRVSVPADPASLR